MIKTFGSKETEKIWNGIRSDKIPGEIQKIGRRKLRMINNAIDINDLQIPPANRLEKLSSKLKGYYSIRINKQWSIIFNWEKGNSFDIKITDYH